MNSKKILTCITFLFITSFSSFAQTKKESTTVKVDISKDTIINFKKPQKSVTHGSVTVEGKKINYDATAGTLILKNKLDTPTISISYISYFKSDVNASHRPITFIHNGGPGSATIWLHMGAWGPQRVSINDTSRTKAPYKTVNNDYSLLDASDLVFIDAPGTGFGEVITKEMGGTGEGKDFFGIDQDARAFTDFIIQFLSETNRWNSPKYLFGESYGTFRSAVVANLLQNEGVGLSGIILLSQLLTYGNMTEAAGENPGDDQAYELILPSFAATAWYHHKLPNHPEKLEPFLKEVEHFAITDYALALNKGASIDTTTFNQVAEKVHQYTGLPVAYIQ
ncbi:MAG: hypothetical protein ABI148_03985, partial [Ginsengibacter sp.]